jgi:hypothetical protein
MNKVNPNLVIIAGLLIGGYLAYNKLFGKSKEEKEAAKALQEQEKTNNIWAGVASLQKTIKPTQTIKLLLYNDSVIKAEKINDAWGTFNDDEEAVYAIFRSLRYQTQVASIVDAYKKLYNKDLLTTLKSNLSDSEFNEVINIIGTKPLGIENKK